MSAFKDMIASDIDNIFLNKDEFAETVTIEGVEVLAVISECNTTAVQEAGGTYFPVQLAVKTSDLPKGVYEGGIVDIDGIVYIVKDISNSCGMTDLILQRNGG